MSGMSRMSMLATASKGGGPVDMLLEAAEIENRLRSHVRELIEPTMTKQRQQALQLKDVKAMIDGIMTEVHDVKRASEGSESFRAVIDTFRAELANIELQRREHEQEVSEKVSMNEIQINELRQSLERKAGDIASVNRALKGMTDSFSHSTQEVTELRRYCIERLDINRDKLAKLRDEFETRIHTMETEHYTFRDNQVGLDTSIAHLRSELGLVKSDVAEAKAGVLDLWRAKVDVQCVEEQQQEFSEFARRVDAHVTSSSVQFGNMVDDVKAHFQTAADVVGNITAQQIREMHAKYKEETKKANVVLDSLDSFPRRQKELEESVNGRVQRAVDDSARERDSIREQMERQLKKAENDRNEMAIDLKQLRRTLEDIENNGGANTTAGGGAISTDMLSMLVESSLLGASLELQDDQDRRSIALFGYKPGAEDGNSALSQHRRSTSRGGACTLPELDGSRSARAGKATPRRRLAPADGTGNFGTIPEPVVTLDKRCLNCSGSQATVLAGFKVACLQYAPSPVEYKKATYVRTELINLRIDLLNQVKEQLQNME